MAQEFNNKINDRLSHIFYFVLQNRIIQIGNIEINKREFWGMKFGYKMKKKSGLSVVNRQHKMLIVPKFNNITTISSNKRSTGRVSSRNFHDTIMIRSGVTINWCYGSNTHNVAWRLLYNMVCLTNHSKNVYCIIIFFFLYNMCSYYTKWNREHLKYCEYIISYGW